jgi:hypothetical protein
VKFLDPNFVNHATQEEIFPKVVVGDAKVCFPVSKYSLWCFSNKAVAPEEPILIPNTSFEVQPLVQVLLRDVSIAYNRIIKKLIFNCFNASILAN